MPMRHPKGSDAPACSPATRIGVSPFELGLHVTAEQADRAARAVLAVALADDGLEALHVQPAAIAARLRPMRGQRVEQLGGAADERLALAPVRAQRIQIGRREPAVLAREPLLEPVAVVALVEPPQLARRR